jgi:hypothetical protein
MLRLTQAAPNIENNRISFSSSFTKKPSCAAVVLAFCPNQMPTAPGDPTHGAASGSKDTPK